MSMKKKYVKNMTEQKGHFENGRWVAESEPSVTQMTENVIDKRFSEATQAVISSVNDMMNVTHDLITTEEGKQYIEKTIKNTQEQIQKSFDEIVSLLKGRLDKR
jgi:hypothetical protein